MSSPYLWLKVLHVLSVTAWLGGALSLAAVSFLFEPGLDRQRLAGLAKASNHIGERLVAPAGMLTLVSGLLAVWTGHLGMPLWVWWGLGAALFILAVGIIVLRTGLVRMATLLDDPATPVTTVMAEAARLRRIGTVVLLVMVSTVIVMVFKPQF
jgi:uncharacterized membrane protein